MLIYKHLSINIIIVFGKKSKLEKIISSSFEALILPYSIFRKTEKNTNDIFFNKVIDNLIGTTFPIIPINLFLNNPSLMATTLAISNSYFIYERFTKKNNDIKEKSKKKALTIDNPKLSLLETIGIISLVPIAIPYLLIKKIPENLVTLCILTPLALAHYNLKSNKNLEEINYNQINTTFKICKFKNKEMHMALEIHKYNFSSYKYSTDVLKHYNYTLLLKEGVKPKKTLNNIPISEILLNLGIKILTSSNEYNYPTIHQSFKGQSLQINYLEEYSQTTGNRAGISNTSNFLLGALGFSIIMNGPQMYFLGNTLNGSNFLNSIKNIPLPGLIVKRDKLMFNKSLEYIEKNPNKIPLINIGNAHFPGMYSLYKGKDPNFNCKEINPKTFYSSTN